MKTLGQIAYEAVLDPDTWSYAADQDLWESAAQAVRSAVLEEAAKACEAEHVGSNVNDECDNEEDGAYNVALQHAAQAIRGLK